MKLLALLLLAPSLAHADFVRWDSRPYRHHDSVERFLQKLPPDRAAVAKVVALPDGSWRVYYERTCSPGRPCEVGKGGDRAE